MQNRVFRRNKLGITLKGDDTLIGVAGFTELALKITEPKLVISYIHLIAVKE
jgi:hypothetical protein